jgi:signal transduction histidine kinase
MHAFDPGEQGIISIKISLDNKELLVTYADNGKGIEDENLNKIFDPFFTTMRARGGTGLGLHLIFNIITQNLKGSIKCESTHGKGSVFYIRLPVP